MKRLVLLLAMLCSLAHAEVLFGIRYSATLGMVKEVYPNATYEKLKPAWLGQDEAFFRVSGYGMSGKLMVAFTDNRPFWASRTPENASSFLRLIESEVTDVAVENYLKNAKVLAAKSDDDALNVKWVRWVPDQAIPLAKLESRYGKASCSMDEAFDTVCKWAARDLHAKMSEDGKAATMLDTAFTEAERSDGVKRLLKR